MKKINKIMDTKEQKNIDISNKENIFESLQFALNFFDWSERANAKKKWLKLLEQAKNGDDNSYNFIKSRNGINEFNNYICSFFKHKNKKKALAKFKKREARLEKFYEIENYLKSYFCNNLEVKGQYNSFYFYNDSKMMRISDHFAVPKRYYKKIGSKIYIGLQFINPNIKYECDIVVFIPNFFNVNRKKQALLLALNKKLDKILNKIKKTCLNQPVKSKINFTYDFYKNLNNLMAFLKENSN